MSNKTPSVLIDTTPLQNANSVRGVGVYTRLLTSFLQKRSDIRVSTSADQPNANDIDMVHYPFFDLFFSTLPLIKTKPTVVTIHDVIPLIFPRQYQPGFKGLLRLWRQKWSLKTVKAIITDSEASKKDIQKYLAVPEKKIKVVYLAANPDLKQQDERIVTRIRKLYSLPKQYILFVGDINYNKNLPQLIKALKFLPEKIHLVCVGKNFFPQDIPEWQWIETQVAMSNVENRIHYITDVLSSDIEQLAGIYTGAVAYVQPSLYEGFGLPVLEAMQTKTPVVCTKNSSLTEVGGDHVVYSSSDQAEDIAAAIQSILDWSKTKRLNWVRAAYKWSQNFSWERAAAQTAEIYKENR